MSIKCVWSNRRVKIAEKGEYGLSDCAGELVVEKKRGGSPHPKMEQPPPQEVLKMSEKEKVHT